jgi:hypothetical protein
VGIRLVALISEVEPTVVPESGMGLKALVLGRDLDLLPSRPTHGDVSRRLPTATRAHESRNREGQGNRPMGHGVFGGQGTFPVKAEKSRDDAIVNAWTHPACHQALLEWQRDGLVGQRQLWPVGTGDEPC